MEKSPNGFRKGNTATMQDLVSRISRKVITSARRDQTALDGGPIEGHSLFTGTFIDGLESRRPDLDGNGFITSSELGLFLQQQVGQSSSSEQTPDFGSFHYDEKGELVIPLSNETHNTKKESAPKETIGMSRPYKSGRDIEGEVRAYMARNKGSSVSKCARDLGLRVSDVTEIISRWSDEK